MCKQDNPNSMQVLMMEPHEAASITRLSERSITRMCKRGELPAVKLGGSWRINRAEFMRLIGAQA